MPNKTFDALADRGTIVDTDILVIAATGTGVTATKTTVADLSTKVKGDLGLGTAATTNATAYATAAQGSLADTALQPSDDISELTNNENYISSDAINSTSGNVLAGSIVDVIALTQEQYQNRTVDANDAKKLFVITDGKTKDSYVGHIETPADGTYYLDPKVAEAREITGVYFAWTAGGSPDGDIDVQIGGTSVLSSTGRMNSGSSFTGTLKTDGTEDVAADAVITVVLGAVNGVADVTDLRFSVEYAQ